MSVIHFENGPFKIVVSSVCVPRRGPCCLLPLWKSLQDQQVALSQASFKLLLLALVSECMRSCVYPLSVESLFSTDLWLSQK